MALTGKLRVGAARLLSVRLSVRLLTRAAGVNAALPVAIGSRTARAVRMTLLMASCAVARHNSTHSPPAEHTNVSHLKLHQEFPFEHEKLKLN